MHYVTYTSECTFFRRVAVTENTSISTYMFINLIHHNSKNRKGKTNNILYQQKDSS